MFSKTDIEKYFVAEKQESLLFLGLGIAAVVVAIIFFFFLKTNFYKGAAVPLVSLGLIMGIVGTTIYKRSDEDRARNVYAYGMDPSQLKNKEIPRMETVMKNFVIYRYMEILFAVAGVFLWIYFRNNTSYEFWKGFGLTLMIMSLSGLGADYFAEKRGHIYLNGLKEFTANIK